MATMTTELLISEEDLYPGMRVKPVIHPESKAAEAFVVSEGNCHGVREVRHLEETTADWLKFQALDACPSYEAPPDTRFVVFIAGKPAGGAFGMKDKHAFVNTDTIGTLWLGNDARVIACPGLPPGSMLVPIRTLPSTT